jgi:hypothetical protein
MFICIYQLDGHSGIGELGLRQLSKEQVGSKKLTSTFLNRREGDTTGRKNTDSALSRKPVHCASNAFMIRLTCPRRQARVAHPALCPDDQPVRPDRRTWSTASALS